MVFWIFILSLLVIKVIVSVAAASPTHVWLNAFGRIGQRWRQRREQLLQRALMRETAGTAFTASQSFLPQGIGLALDPTHRLLFVADPAGNTLRAAVLPYDAVGSVRRGEMNMSGFYNHYVELAVRGGKPAWRFLCGDDPALAHQVEDALRAVQPVAAEPV